MDNFNYALATILADRLHHLRHPNNAMAGLDCAPLPVGISVAIETVQKNIKVELDFVTALVLLYCANALIFAKFVLMFLELVKPNQFLLYICTWMVVITKLSLLLLDEYPWSF